MKVKVVHDFYDKEADLELRKKGTTLEVTKERAAHLQGMGLVKAVEVKAKSENAQEVIRTSPVEALGYASYFYAPNTR